MKIVIGIDTVAVERFAHFYTYTRTKLERIFSTEEIDYALSNPLKTAERFAARFAAKEAFLKAYAQLLPEQTLSLLAITPLVTIHKKNGIPFLAVEWEELKRLYTSVGSVHTSVSLTHTECHASASIILYTL